MAQPQQNINIAAPAFAGINTEDSPLQTGDSFASVADNCVIDRYGRLGSRRGFESITSDGSAYGGATVESIHEHVAFTTGNVNQVFTFAGDRMYQGTDIPADVTPVGLTSSDWSHGQVGDISFWAAEGNEMLYYVGGTNTVHPHVSAPGNPHVVRPTGNVCTGAYGRAWTYERNSATSDRGTLWISDLLIPYEFDSGSAGSIILDNVWPDGNDDVIGMAAHNGFMILFGRTQILVYANADDDPATNMSLVDHLSGIGCVSRDSVQSTGSDILWLDDTGVRSFNRTIQEKSLPIGDVSANVRSEIVEAITQEQTGDGVFGKAVYSQASGLYAITFPTSGYIYVFNMARGPLENGAYRTTRWTGLQQVKCAVFTADDRTLVGGEASVAHYTNYLDWGQSYRMRYYSNPLDFDTPARVKIVKQCDLIIIGGLDMDLQLNWAFDFQTNFRKKGFTIPGGNAALYNISEYNMGAEYTSGTAVRTVHLNVGGKGRFLTIGIEGEVLGPISLQEVSIQTLIGRII